MSEQDKVIKPQIIKNDDGCSVQVFIPKNIMDVIYNKNKDTKGFDFDKSLLVCAVHEIITSLLIESKDYLSFFHAAFMLQHGISSQIEHVLKLSIHEGAKQETTTETVQ